MAGEIKKFTAYNMKKNSLKANELLMLLNKRMPKKEATNKAKVE
jgi:hypothetical protein